MMDTLSATLRSRLARIARGWRPALVDLLGRMIARNREAIDELDKQISEIESKQA
jgi:hypothetical protein